MLLPSCFCIFLFIKLTYTKIRNKRCVSQVTNIHLLFCLCLKILEHWTYCLCLSPSLSLPLTPSLSHHSPTLLSCLVWSRLMVMTLNCDLLSSVGHDSQLWPLSSDGHDSQLWPVIWWSWLLNVTSCYLMVMTLKCESLSSDILMKLMLATYLSSPQTYSCLPLRLFI